MEIRIATKADLTSVLDIYERARKFMREHANPDQWADSYPPVALVESDIACGALHLLVEDGAIQGVFAFFPDGDPIYDSIDGKWLNDLPHAAVHRVASAGRRRGILSSCMDFCARYSSNIKIDTHPQNTVMQSALKKLGFVPCGYVGELLAFQRSEIKNK